MNTSRQITHLFNSSRKSGQALLKRRDSLNRKTTTLLGILLFLSPFCASAEAGRGITDEDVILLLSALVVIAVNQIFLTITAMKKIMKPEVKSSVLHYISFVIAIVIFAIYIPNSGTGGLPLFKVFVILPFILGAISILITLFNLMKKKS